MNDVVRDGITPPSSHLVGAHEARVIDAARTVLNWDASWNSGDGSLHFGEWQQDACGQRFLAANLHNGGANFSFADGHVKWLSAHQQTGLDCAMFHMSET